MGVSDSIFDASLSSIALIKTRLGGDEKENEVAVINDVWDIDAALWNKIVAYLAEVGYRLRPGNLCVLSFSAPDVSATGSGPNDLYRCGGGDTANKIALPPWSGSIVGLAARVESARTAGTLTINVEVGGTPATFNVAIDGTNTQEVTSNQLPGVETFSAGDTIEVTWTSDGTWATAGGTPSLDVDLYLSFQD